MNLLAYPYILKENTITLNADIRLSDETERQLLKAAFDKPGHPNPMQFFKRFANALAEMSRDLVAARAKCSETQLV